MLEQKNSKKQGDVGLGFAISYFTKCGYCVSIPLTDSQNYDLVVEMFGGLKKIQVKTTRFMRRGSYQANLKVCGGNKSGNSIKNFDNTSVDFVFILTEDSTMYLIPSIDINSRCSISLNESRSKYIVT